MVAELALVVACSLRLEANEKLGYEPLIEHELSKPFHAGEERFIITARHPQFGMELAFLDITHVGPQAVIEKSEVMNENNYRKGLTTLLLAEMRETHPKLTTIEANLADVNYRTANRAFEQEGLDCEEAVALTPLFKAALKVGFQLKTAECNPASHEYKFVMTLEPPH